MPGRIHPLSASPAPVIPLALADVRPPALVGVIVLLLVNPTLSVAVTVAALVTHGALARHQLDHLHVADAALRRDTAAAAEHAPWLRIGANATVSVACAFPFVPCCGDVGGRTAASSASAPSASLHWHLW